MSNSIFINKEKRSFFKSALKNISLFFLLIFSFWFNFTFLDGNNFFDVIIFLCFLFFIFGRIREIIDSGNYYYDISDEKINKIKNILDA